MQRNFHLPQGLGSGGKPAWVNPLGFSGQKIGGRRDGLQTALSEQGHRPRHMEGGGDQDKSFPAYLFGNNFGLIGSVPGVRLQADILRLYPQEPGNLGHYLGFRHGIEDSAAG
jgi:hypothetical protein